MYGLLVESAIRYVQKKFGNETLQRVITQAQLDINLYVINHKSYYWVTKALSIYS